MMADGLIARLRAMDPAVDEIYLAMERERARAEAAEARLAEAERERDHYRGAAELLVGAEERAQELEKALQAAGHLRLNAEGGTDWCWCGPGHFPEDEHESKCVEIRATLARKEGP